MARGTSRFRTTLDSNSSTSRAVSTQKEPTAGKSRATGLRAIQPSEGHQQISQVELVDWWQTCTQRLVDLSALVFVFLLVPQLIKNGTALAAGNSAALAGLSWVGFATALMANTQLLGYFVDKREASAAFIQAIGVVSNYAVLFQIAWAGYLPPALTPLLLAAAVVTSGMVALHALTASTPTSLLAWRAWQALTGIAGIIVVPQVLSGTFFGVESLWPAALASIPAAALLFLDASGRLSGSIAHLWSSLSAWSATLLFCCQPIAQLARNLAAPEAVSSLSLVTVLLATLGNGMMVPRALITRDLIWSVGSVWGSVAMGWGNLLCIMLASSATGSNQLSPQAFAVVSGLMLTYFTAVVMTQLRVRRAQCTDMAAKAA